jgi:hypothetical protein
MSKTEAHRNRRGTTMTTLNTTTTAGRNVKRVTLGVVAVLAIIGAASTFAVAQMSVAQLVPTVAGEPDGTFAASPVGAAHPEPFLAAPRWNGSWSRSR